MKRDRNYKTIKIFPPDRCLRLGRRDHHGAGEVQEDDPADDGRGLGPGDQGVRQLQGEHHAAQHPAPLAAQLSRLVH